MVKRWKAWCRSGKPGAGAVLAIVLLAAVEWALHTEGFLHRLRSVFAAGRAFDKVLYVERHPPQLLVLGNSRMDNGIDPRTLVVSMGHGLTAFNLGLPGANATVLYGIVRRLDDRACFGQGRIGKVLIGLDEDLVQTGDALGYEVFFVRRPLTFGNPSAFLKTHVRLWGYADNLKQLREPGKLAQLFRALVESTDPIGGGAAARLGYRPGFGGAQDAAQVARQEVGSTAPPSEEVVSDLFAMVDFLERRGVEVAIVFPPLLTRTVLYLDPSRSAARPYGLIANRLAGHGVPMYALGASVKILPSEFVNAGHLNDAGAQRFSAMLGAAMANGAEAGLVRVVGP